MLRTSRTMAGLVLVTAAFAAAGLPAAQSATTSPACANVSTAAGQRLMNGYRDAGSYPARQPVDRRGVPTAVTVQIPPIAFTGPGASSTLPAGPCQTIYRFAFPRVVVAGGATAFPFRYVEVDWNTEGVPRGPNNSFLSAHFDFHYYLRPRAEVDRTTMCESSNGRTCDPTLTPYPQMRRFLDMPPASLVPPGYYADVGSSIPLMGLHLLDGRFHYTVDSVDHHPTLLYGTFAGRMLFAEASVTLANLQDVIAAPGHTLSYPYRQPRRVQGNTPWPTRFTVTYDPGTQGFTAGFTGFRTHGRAAAFPG